MKDITHPELRLRQGFIHCVHEEDEHAEKEKDFDYETASSEYDICSKCKLKDCKPKNKLCKLSSYKNKK